MLGEANKIIILITARFLWIMFLISFYNVSMLLMNYD